MPADARNRFIDLLRTAVHEGTLLKLTLGKPCGPDATLKNVFVRPVTLKAGAHFAFVWRHATRDITKNLPPDSALLEIERLLGAEFLDAHLFTSTQTAQLETKPDGQPRLKVGQVSRLRQGFSGQAGLTLPTSQAHDRTKNHLIAADAPWLRALGVTNDRGRPREGMADKFNQIQKFAELLTHLIDEAAFPAGQRLCIVDMGSGKGYLTFAIAALLGERADVQGIEARPALVELCNRVARENNLTNLTFAAGQIDSFEIDHRESKIENSVDVLIALHACDTATDDALAKGIAAGAKLIVVAPCCQKELRPQLTAPPVLADALRHGIFQERTAEFVTDALRAMLLQWAGYKTKVFEFISTAHTAKNLMIAAIKSHPTGDVAAATRVREFAAFYGVWQQQLATHLKLPLRA